MGEIQYTEETEFQRPAPIEEKSFLVQLLLNNRLAKTDRGAEYLLAGVAGTLLICMLIIFFMSNGTNARPLNKQDIRHIIELQKNTR
jgi:hypothetical protein